MRHDRFRRRELRRYHRHYHRGPSSVWGGAVILLVGVVLLLDRLGVLYAQQVFQFWPMLLVAGGLALLLQLVHTGSLGSRVFGGLVMAAGMLLQANYLGFVHLRGNVFWPFVLIGLGIILLVKALESQWRPAPTEPVEGQPTDPGMGNSGFREEEDTGTGRIRGSVVFSSAARRVISQDFEKAKIEAVFGGYELDLRPAGMAGYEARVNADAVFGGIEIRVPLTWDVVLQGEAVFGSFSDFTQHPAPVPGVQVKRLFVKGAAVFGSVEVTNGPGEWRG